MTGYYNLTFTNSEGQSIVFSEALPYVLQSVQGLDFPESDIQTKRAPYQDGTTFTDALLQSRDIVLEVHIKGVDNSAIYSARDTLGNVFSPKKGKGTLTIEYESTSRSIGCVCERVLMPNSDGNRTCGYQKAQIRLFADNPAILDSEFTTISVTAFEGGFSLPFSFPFNLGTLGSSKTISNTGHLERPVIITAVGALQTPTFTNETTGEKIELSNAGGLNLLIGETLTIDTNSSEPSITITDGTTTTNAYKYLSADSALWQLILGDNVISYTAVAQDENPNISIKKGYISV